MKKIFLTIMILLLSVFLLVSCSKKEPSDNEGTESGGNTSESGENEKDPGDDKKDDDGDEEDEPHLYHVFGSWNIVKPVTCVEDGENSRSCKICGYTETATLKATGHVYSEKWKSDSTYHWHAPLCGDITEPRDKEEHAYVVDEIPVVATATKDGKKILVCPLCHRAKVELIPKGTHSIMFIAEVPATCTEPGVKEHYECLGCHKVFSDENAENELTSDEIILKAPGHKKSDDFSFDGESHWYSCTTCGERLDIEYHVSENGVCKICHNRIPEFTSGLEYALIGEKDEYAVIGNGTASANEIFIPETYNGLPVTSISAGAFSDCAGITSVKIPETVTRIESGAFKNCVSLKKVIIPSSVTFIGNGAFSGCANLEYETVDGVNYLGAWVLGVSNDKLTSITVRAGTVGIGYAAFQTCSELSEINLPEGLIIIEDYAFMGCEKLRSVTLPESLKEIGEKAFICCGFTNVVIPGNTETLGKGVFFGCASLKGIYLVSETIPEGFDSEWKDGCNLAECYFGGSWSYTDVK